MGTFLKTVDSFQETDCQTGYGRVAYEGRGSLTFNDVPGNLGNLQQEITITASSVLTLSPGVIATGNTGTGPIVSGGRSHTSSILFDGQDTRNNSTLDNAYTPPQETISEIRFITNNFSAEYGRSAGGILVVAGRSGGNQFHGSVYDYLKNDKLNANSWTNNRNSTARARQRHNEYGFLVSGPVVLPHVYNGRNKTFVLFNWEQVSDHGANQQNQTVPTALQKAGDFSQTFTSSGALISIYDPLTTVPDPTQKSGCSRQQFPNNVIPATRIDPMVEKRPISCPARTTWMSRIATSFDPSQLRTIQEAVLEPIPGNWTR